MTTLRQLRKRAKELGAKVVINGFNSYDQSTCIEVEAPDGKCWAEGPQVLVSFYFSYAPESMGEVFHDLMERMSYGLEDHSEKD